MTQSVDLKTLIKQNFDFLVNEFGFEYAETPIMFYNEKLTIYITYDRLSPTIQLWLRAEPEFTAIDMGWLLYGKIDYASIDKNLLEDNIVFYAQIFREYADQLIYQTERMLLPGLKRLFLNMIRNNPVNDDNLRANLSFSEKRYYDYIRARDPDWDPRLEL